MKVENIDDNRFRIAIEFLKEDQALNFNNVHFTLSREKGLVEVGSESTWSGEITQETAFSDIQRGISTFEYLIKHSSDFADAVKGYVPRFSLIVDDGMVTVDVAYLLQGEIVFVVDNSKSNPQLRYKNPALSH